MSDKNPSILSHVSLGTRNLPTAIAFYDRVLGTLGISRLENIDDEACAYGKQFAEFWICLPLNDKESSSGNGVHVGFTAESREAVQAFHTAALDAGATDNGAPGPRPHYGAPYYGCFVLDLDGNNIEACFWDAELER